MKETKERVIEKLMFIYKGDMEKVANEMQSVDNYIDLADLYDKSAGIIRTLQKELEEVENGNK